MLSERDRLLALITAQAEALVEAERLITWQHKEIGRLKEGNFTPEEFQNLCHNLPPNSLPEFAEGCRKYQARLFGEQTVRDYESRCRRGEKAPQKDPPALPT